MGRRRSPHRRAENPDPIRLTKRDKRIFETIHACDGMMSRAQIDRLFFSGKGRTQPRQRMQALFDHGYVNMPGPDEIHQVPLGEVIYWLDRKGAKIVAGLRGADLSGFSWRKKPRWSLIEHDLKVNDFRIAVRDACDRSPLLSLYRWVPEGAFRTAPDKVPFRTAKGKRTSRQVIPDGFFTIRRPDQGHPGATEEFAFLLEVDMATESNPRFAREKVRAGVAYLRSDAYRERFAVDYGAYLVVTTGEKRAQHLKHATERAGGEGLFYFTTFDDVTPAGVLTTPIWQIAGSDDATTIIPDENVISNAGGRR